MHKSDYGDNIQNIIVWCTWYIRSNIITNMEFKSQCHVADFKIIILYKRNGIYKLILDPSPAQWLMSLLALAISVFSIVILFFDSIRLDGEMIYILVWEIIQWTYKLNKSEFIVYLKCLNIFASLIIWVSNYK